MSLKWWKYSFLSKGNTKLDTKLDRFYRVPGRTDHPRLLAIVLSIARYSNYLVWQEYT